MNWLSQCSSKFALATLLSLAAACSSTSQSEEQRILRAEIDYPFADRTEPLGKNNVEDKFVIRSTVGNTEYHLEIPGAARDYDIEVPLADLQKVGASSTVAFDDENIGLPQATDRELIRAMPKLKEAEDKNLVQGAFGLGEGSGPKQSPSYTVGIARIVKLYKAKKYEYGLIQINNLLTYYPTSPRLYKMKGTTLMKLRNHKLAEVAWSRALELNPQDQSLRQALDKLRVRIREDQQTLNNVVKIQNGADPSAPKNPAH